MLLLTDADDDDVGAAKVQANTGCNDDTIYVSLRHDSEVDNDNSDPLVGVINDMLTPKPQIIYCV